MQMWIANRPFETLHCIRLHRVEHEEAEEAIRILRNRSGYTDLVAMSTCDQAGALDSVTIELLDPLRGEDQRIGRWDLPIENGSQRFGVVEFLLAGQTGIKVMREEMDVGVNNGEVAPRRLSHAE